MVSQRGLKLQNKSAFSTTRPYDCILNVLVVRVSKNKSLHSLKIVYYSLENYRGYNQS